MHTANERWRYSVTPSLIGWAHTRNAPCGWYVWCWQTGLYQCLWGPWSWSSWSWSSLGCLLDLSEVWEVPWWYSLYISGSVQDCNNSIASAMELLQSCAKPSSHVYRPTLDTGITLMALCKRGVTLFWIHLSCTPSASTKRCTCGIFHVSCTHSHCISLFLNINVKFSQLIWITSRSIIDQYNVSKHWCRWKLIINQTPNAALLTC